ncbi:MAG: type II toxin-antitoxin system Phd/YefM family antitoxin [Acidobacteriia bacterium]|nr:type II toxin-antitoxin system Phd/YefM family antitoxin [Terriglobia bacterium]
MEHTIRATDLARNLGDVLSKVRYRRDSFVVWRSGRPVARIVPIEDGTKGATLGDALSIWCDGAESDPAFADDLDVINASDKPATNPWES